MNQEINMKTKDIKEFGNFIFFVGGIFFLIGVGLKLSGFETGEMAHSSDPSIFSIVMFMLVVGALIRLTRWKPDSIDQENLSDKPQE
jgi:hypothetical protein